MTISYGVKLAKVSIYSPDLFIISTGTIGQKGESIMRRKKANCKLFLNQEKNHQLHTVIYKKAMQNIGNQPLS